MTTINAIQSELESIKSELIAKYNAKGMRASGKWEQSLNIQMQSLSGALFGEDYTKQLEQGQDAGEVSADDKTFRKRIEQWIIDKRIQSNIKVSSLAFLIARKIQNEGWKREDYGGVNLLSEVLTPQRIEKMFTNIGESITVEVAEYMNKLEVT